jgi:hypothetical protein
MAHSSFDASLSKGDMIAVPNVVAVENAGESFGD